jgi:hypothetical protein
MLTMLLPIGTCVFHADQLDIAHARDPLIRTHRNVSSGAVRTTSLDVQATGPHNFHRRYIALSETGRRQSLAFVNCVRSFTCRLHSCTRGSKQGTPRQAPSRNFDAIRAAAAIMMPLIRLHAH